MNDSLALIRPRQRGFSLIEALVTLVIIGLGVLAAAGLQIGARKGQQEAAQRTTASAAIQDLIERMNGNAPGRDTYIKALAVNPSASGSGLALGPDCRGTNSCTSAQIAEADLGRWWGNLTGTNVTIGTEPTPMLAEPTVCLCLRPNSVNDYRLTLAWRGAGPAGGYADEDAATSLKAGMVCGDTESMIYDDPETDAPDVSLRRTETVRYVFPNEAPATAPAAAPACKV